MVRIDEQNVTYRLLWYLSILALVLIGCFRPGIQEEQAPIESHASTIANPKTLYLGVSFHGSTYQLIHAHISDSVFTSAPIIKIYGTYGVQVVTENNEVSFDQYTWMKPINGTIRLPFSDSTAFIELIQRIRDEKFVIGRFSRSDILAVTI